jgi:dipeptidase E
LYYSEIGAKLDVYADEVSVSGDCISQLLQCDAIHLSGGNTFTFAQWLRQSNLFDALIRYVESGRPLIGVSAGAILLTKSIASAALCGDSKPDDMVDERGLSLVQFGFWPHFSGYSGMPSTEDQLQDTYGTLYACPNGCAVLVDEMHVESFGQVEVLIYDV